MLNLLYISSVVSDKSPPKKMFQVRDDLIIYGIRNGFISTKIDEFMIVKFS